MIAKIRGEVDYAQQAVTRFVGWFTIGAAGVITAQATTNPGRQLNGVTWSKNVTGDYRAALDRSYKACIYANCATVIPVAGTAPTIAAGNDVTVEGITAANFAGTTPISGFAIAACRSDTDALADPTNGVTITYAIELVDL